MGLFLPAGCSKNSHTGASSGEKTTSSKPPVTGSRIAWDYSTLRRFSSGTKGARYNGYARIIQLHDHSLIGVYEADGSVIALKSRDLGKTWSAPITVAAKPEGFHMAVPDILELQDKSLLVCYNPRPHDIAPARKFGIRTKKSYDGGLTWQDERLVYEAGYQFENGCWEPAAVQLPDGEIQLYFANEGPYTTSSEQNISMLRSRDKGLTWFGEPVTVSFRAGKRDGMPVPLLLQSGKDVVVAIEDNGDVDFKPYIVRSTLANAWQGPVNATSPDRSYALAEPVADDVYAGAPYIRQLSTGETIMAYQGTEGRPGKLSSAEMKVVIGDAQAQDFNRKTAPFAIPDNKSGLWNSLSVLHDNSVIALTSTNAFSDKGNREVWMVKGYVIPELKVGRHPVAVDGAQREDLWTAPFPVFIGHKSATQLHSQLAYDNRYLYVLNKVKDASVVSDAPNPEDNDGVWVQLDPGNKSYEKPGKGVFTFFLSADNKLVAREGGSGRWVSLKNAGGIKTSSRLADSGYVQEVAIPWAVLGGKPARGTRMGFNMRLTENTGGIGQDYKENIPANNEEQPFTWLTVKLQ